MAQNTQTFSPVTDAQWQKLVAALKEQGLTVVGTSGELSKMGVDAYFKYDDLTLTVTVIHAPFFIGINGAADRIKKAINGVLEST